MIYTKRGHPVQLEYYRIEEHIWQDKALFYRLAIDSLNQTISLQARKACEPTRLYSLPNISINIERKLYRLGIKNIECLQEMGAIKAFILLKNDNHNLKDGVLFDLEGAIRGCHKAVLPSEIKQELICWLKNNAHLWYKKKA